MKPAMHASDVRPQIVAVTGTKGKSTITRVISSVLQSVMPEPILTVDTHHAYLGSERIAGLNDSRRTSGLNITVAPGRYLFATQSLKQPVAVLEASLGCGVVGTGYQVHQVGIFTNVYDDHLGTTEALQSREDIAAMKSFIFARIGRNGWAVYNADEALVTSQLDKIKPDKNVRRLAVTLVDRQMAADEDALATVQDGSLVIRTKDGIAVSAAIADAPWLLNGEHAPTLINGLFSLAGLWSFFTFRGEELPQAAIKRFCEYSWPEDGGRMVIKRARDGYTVILDFAHEAISINELGAYARRLAGPDHRTFGLIRLSGERPDTHIKQTSRAVAKAFDKIVVFDKIDGHYKSGDERRAVGEVSQLMYDELNAAGASTERVVREDHAMQAIAHEVQPGDVVVAIVTNPERSLEFANQAFQLEEK